MVGEIPRTERLKRSGWPDNVFKWSSWTRKACGLNRTSGAPSHWWRAAPRNCGPAGPVSEIWKIASRRPRNKCSVMKNCFTTRLECAATENVIALPDWRRHSFVCGCRIWRSCARTWNWEGCVARLTTRNCGRSSARKRNCWKSNSNRTSPIWWHSNTNS